MFPAKPEKKKKATFTGWLHSSRSRVSPYSIQTASINHGDLRVGFRQRLNENDLGHGSDTSTFNTTSKPGCCLVSSCLLRETKMVRFCPDRAWLMVIFLFSFSNLPRGGSLMDSSIIQGSARTITRRGLEEQRLCLAFRNPEWPPYQEWGLSHIPSREKKMVLDIILHWSEMWHEKTTPSRRTVFYLIISKCSLWHGSSAGEKKKRNISARLV